jgi:hypothetical protein
MHPAREGRPPDEQRNGWNRQADGTAPRSPTNRLTGPAPASTAGCSFAGPDGREAPKDRPGRQVRRSGRTRPQGGSERSGSMRRASRCSSTLGCGTHSRCSIRHHSGRYLLAWIARKRVRQWLRVTVGAGDSGAGSNAGPILFAGRPYRLEPALRGRSRERSEPSERQAHRARSHLRESAGSPNLGGGRVSLGRGNLARASRNRLRPHPRACSGKVLRAYFFSMSWPRIAPPGNWALWMLT